MSALLADLAQRIHWAYGWWPAEPYPEPAPREATHDLRFPAGESAGRSFATDVVALGGRDVWTRPAGEPAGTWLVGVSFGELPPDPGFRARAGQLAALATRHGGRYEGHHG